MLWSKHLSIVLMSYIGVLQLVTLLSYEVASSGDPLTIVNGPTYKLFRK